MSATTTGEGCPEGGGYAGEGGGASRGKSKARWFFEGRVEERTEGACSKRQGSGATSIIFTCFFRSPATLLPLRMQLGVALLRGIIEGCRPLEGPWGAEEEARFELGASEAVQALAGPEEPEAMSLVCRRHTLAG